MKKPNDGKRNLSIRNLAEVAIMPERKIDFKANNSIQ